jgi:hypothetical protein
MEASPRLSAWGLASSEYPGCLLDDHIADGRTRTADPVSGSRQATVACSWRGRPDFRARTPGAPPLSISGRVSANRPRRRPLSGRSMTRAGTLEAPLDPHPLRFTHRPLHPHMETRSAHLQVPLLQWFSGLNNFRSRDRWQTALLTLGCSCKRPAAGEEQGDEQIVQRQQVWFEEIPGQGKSLAATGHRASPLPLREPRRRCSYPPR